MNKDVPQQQEEEPPGTIGGIGIHTLAGHILTNPVTDRQSIRWLFLAIRIAYQHRWNHFSFIC